MKDGPHTINVKGTEIAVVSEKGNEFFCLTDMAKSFGGEKLIENWIRSKNTVEFLGVWERMNNPNFNSLEFEGIKNAAGSNRFVMSAKQWITKTGAKGIIAKTGRYGGGTYGHEDIAMEFATWLSPEFRLYVVKEFKRLKQEEASTSKADWDIRRVLAKANYRIHTDAIKETLIPARNVPKNKEGTVYASEAEMLNQVVFGMTAVQWKAKQFNAPKSQNIRDSANILQLTVLSNLESMNAELIRDGMSMKDRFLKLSVVANGQFQSLEKTKFIIEQSEKTIFDPRPKLAPPSKAPAIKPVDSKSLFDDMKRAVSSDDFRPITPKKPGESIQKGAPKN